MSMHEASAGKFGLLSNQGISGSIPLEAENAVVPLTYLFLREGSSCGACEKLGYLFSRTQGIILIPR